MKRHKERPPCLWAQTERPNNGFVHENHYYDNTNGQILQGGRTQVLRNNLQTARKAAGLTQQAMADKLGLTLRHYQKIEYADINGAFEVWDALEDLLGVHQRILRETSSSHPGPKENL